MRDHLRIARSLIAVLAQQFCAIRMVPTLEASAHLLGQFTSGNHIKLLGRLFQD
jgi:hypothetical protein